MNLFFLKIPPIPAQLVIYVGSLASFNFRPPQNNSKGAIARKKKIWKKETKSSVKEKNSEKGEEEFCLYSPVKTSLPALTWFAFSLILLPQHIHIYFFF